MLTYTASDFNGKTYKGAMVRIRANKLDGRKLHGLAITAQIDKSNIDDVIGFLQITAKMLVSIDKKSTN